jgi:tRNA(fMet)-specific endonuclease VapC
MQGRFDSVLKAADADQLRTAQERLLTAERDLAKFVIVPFAVSAGIEFDRLRENKKLKRIGHRDLLIASIALANSATLVTRNLRHFRQVPGLRLENWAD